MNKKLFNLLFRRLDDADDISKYPNWRVGLSSAASWSWSVSLAVGMSIMYKYGLLPFIIWTIGNILAIPLFGFIRTYFPLSKNWPRFVFPMVLLFFFVEFFCIILNLQGILVGFGGNVKGIISYNFLPAAQAKYIVIAIGLFIVWYIHKGGLKISVLTDLGQYSIQLLAVIVMTIIGYCSNESNNIEWVVVNQTVNGLEWVKFGFFGIIVGALGTSHHWQRFSAIKEKNILKTSLWGGGLFGIYMAFVCLTGLFFSSNIILGSLFLITILALATSSIDSAVAGMEYVVGLFGLKHYVATIIASIAVLFWPYFIESGMVGVWSFMASQRLKVIGTFIIVTVLLTFIKRFVNIDRVIRPFEKLLLKER